MTATSPTPIRPGRPRAASTALTGKRGPTSGERPVTGYSQHYCSACREVHGFGFCAYAARRTSEDTRFRAFDWD